MPGFFVHRFQRKMRRRRCEKCGEMNDYSQEKEVDTTMVADMLRLAAVDAFDAVILASGDSDHAPAVEGGYEPSANRCTSRRGARRGFPHGHGRQPSTISI